MPSVFLTYLQMCVDAFVAFVAFVALVAPPAFAAPLCVLIVGRQDRTLRNLLCLIVGQ
jgi:hypothetical protein